MAKTPWGPGQSPGIATRECAAQSLFNKPNIRYQFPMTEALETRLAHLERLSEELNEVVANQANEIDRLTQQVALLMRREAEREADGGGGVILGDERPPHY